MCVLDGIERSERQPANIFVIKQSGAEVVKVVDFGIATQTGGQNSARLTAPGMVLGTAEYMAPEQAQGQPVDHRLDQYALGCIMWEMLTGRVPFDGGHPTATMLKHLTDRTRPPSEVAPNQRIPPELDQIVVRAMSKDPANRYPSMTELEEALASQFSQLKQRSPSTAGLQLVRMPTTQLSTRLFAVVSLGVVLIFGGALSLRWLLQKRSGLTATGVVQKSPSVVHWRIDSQPQGAEIYSVSDGRKLGVTPWLAEETMESGQLAVELRKPGFVSKQLVLSRNADEDRTEALAPRKDAKSSRKKDRSDGSSSSSKRRKTKENSQVDLIID
ncbi:MAG: serine/threonine protein kinase [Myxococcales bacterium]|nr:serine/threonine protein kinase [Myxococcales bacterium]